MKILIIAIALVAVAGIFVGCRCGRGTEQPTREQFVSMTCDKGDITLTLETDGSFTLVLKHWDPTTQQHTQEDRMSGTWAKHGGQLVLMASDSTLTYKPETNNFTIGGSSLTVQGYGWVSSTSKTPFDTYPLVEKDKTDAFLLKAAETKKR